jgi:hypothetical protein
VKNVIGTLTTTNFLAEFQRCQFTVDDFRNVNVTVEMAMPIKYNTSAVTISMVPMTPLKLR